MEEAEVTTREEAVAGESRKLLLFFCFCVVGCVLLFILLSTSSHLSFLEYFTPINSYGGGGGYGQQQGGGGGYGGR